MTTKLHPAVEALNLQKGPWERRKDRFGSCSFLIISESGKEVADIAMYGDGHQGLAGGRDPREIEDTSHLVATSPEMLSWMVQDLTSIGMTDEELREHKRAGRDIIRRASNGKINL